MGAFPIRPRHCANAAARQISTSSCSGYRCYQHCLMHLLDLKQTSLPSVYKMVRHHRVSPRSTLQVPLGRALSQIEKGAILGTLARVGENQYMAAPLLGIGVKTLYRRPAEYRLP